MTPAATVSVGTCFCGGGTLKKVPTETVAAGVIVLIVQGRLRVAQVSLQRGFEPRLDSEGIVEIEVWVVRHNRGHAAILGIVINPGVSGRGIVIAGKGTRHLVESSRE